MSRTVSNLFRLIALSALFLILVTVKSFAFSVKITPLELNQWYTLKTPATIVTAMSRALPLAITRAPLVADRRPLTHVPTCPTSNASTT